MPPPGTRAIMLHMENIVTGALSTLAETSEYIPAKREAINNAAKLEPELSRDNKYAYQVKKPPREAKNKFFPFILNSTPKPSDAKNE